MMISRRMKCVSLYSFGLSFGTTQSLNQFCQNHFPLKFGNNTQIPSDYGFFKRKSLERKLNKSTLMPFGNKTAVSPFVVLYADLMSSIAQNDLRHLQLICQKNLFSSLKQGLTHLTKTQGIELYFADEKKTTNYKLINMKIVKGVLIQRETNRGTYKLQISKDKMTHLYSRVQDATQNLGEETEITQITLQFTSNLRIWVVKRSHHQKELDLTDRGAQVELDPVFEVGKPPQFYWEKEIHLVTFEKYLKMSEELQDKRRQQGGFRNPWVITDLDFFLKWNPFCKIE